MNVKRIGGALLAAASALGGVLALSPANPVSALAAGTAPDSAITLSASTGTSYTQFALQSASPVYCPGDANAGYRWDTFITNRTQDPATMTYSLGYAQGVATTDALANISSSPIINVDPSPGDGQITLPTNVSFRAARYTSLPAGSYWVGLACVKKDGSNIYQTERYWALPLTITRPGTGTPNPNNFNYAVGMAPNAPTLGTLTAGDAQVDVAFTAAAKINGNPDDTGYKVLVKDATCTSDVKSVSGASSPITVSGLENGTTYCFSVVAANSFGDGPASSTGTATPITPLTATPGNKSVALTWNAAPWSGLAPLTDYTIEFRRFGTGTWRSAKKVVSTATSFTVLGLTNGLDYEFRVAGKNALTTGSYQVVGPVIPRAVPGKPRSVKLTPRNASAVVTWAAPASNGGNAITDYVIELWNGTTWSTVTDGVSTDLAYTITGLVNGTGYKVRVSAINDAGTGLPQATAKAVKPYLSLPTAPQTVKATPRNLSVVVTWKAPKNDGGEPISDYKVEWSTDGVTWSSANAGTALTYTIPGLLNGTGYKVRVSATNTVFVGYGPTAGTAKAVKPYLSLPTAPQTVKATPRNLSVVVTWKAPKNDGGEPISDYQVEWSTDGVTWSSANAGTALTYTIPGLVNGTGYKVRVSATNTVFVGYGPTAGTAKAVKPYLSLPTAPQTVKATAASASLVVTWKAPKNDGGEPISDYQVEWSTDGVTWSSANAGTALTYTITGLVPGTGYKVRVSATNTVFVGYGPTAAIARPVKPKA